MECSVCGLEKEREAFPKLLCGRCKECKYEYTRQWKKKNRDKVNASCKKWVENNRDKYNESQRKTYNKYIEKRREYGRSLWHKLKNRYLPKIKNKRDAFKEEHGITHTTAWRNGGKEQVLKILKNATCMSCGTTIDLCIHHNDNRGRYNLKRGMKANNDPNNLTVLCRSCHARHHMKGNTYAIKK
jgi:hypothetical protein